MHGRVKLANGLLKARNYAGASQVLTQHLKQHGDDVDALYLYATTLYRAGERDLAEAAYRKVVRLAPNHALAHYGLGVALARAGRIDEARQSLETALQLDPALDGARTRLAQLATASPGPGTTTTDGPTPAPAKAPVDDEEHLKAGDLLGAGHRRLSSYGGRMLVAACLAALGFALLLTHQPRRLRWFAERPPFQLPSLGFLRERAAATGQEEHQRALDEALARADSLSQTFDTILVGTAVALVLLGVLLVLHAALASAATQYEVYERRIDVQQGVLNRRSLSVWLYEITDVELRQSPMLTLTGNAEIRISLPQRGYAKPSRFDDPTKVRIIGFGSLRDQQRLWREVRDAALRERRVMRRWYL